MSCINPDFTGSFVGCLSAKFGLEPEALLYFITIFSGIFIAICHFFFIYKLDNNIQNIWIICIGSFLLFINFGMDMIHIYIAMIFSFMILKTIPDSVVSAIIITVASMAHYIIGTMKYNKNRYNINWTLPYCILILKMISLHWDAYDATLNNDQLSSYQLNNKLVDEPEFLEVLAFYINPLTIFAGPQFSLAHHRKWIMGAYFPRREASNEEKEEFNLTILKYSMSRLLLGLLFIGIYIMSFRFVTTEDFLSERFLDEWPFFKRILFMFIYTQCHFVTKYMGIWLIVESACVIAGLGFEYPLEQTSLSLVEPNFCSGTIPSRFFMAYSFKHIVDSFNVSTNRWVMHYLYKRFKFINNKAISQLLSLIFLAAWHGLRTGYFVLFASEFLLVQLEQGILKLLDKLGLLQYFESGIGRLLGIICGKLWLLFAIQHPIMAFTLLDYKEYGLIFKQNYYTAYIPLIWPLIEAIAN